MKYLLCLMLAGGALAMSSCSKEKLPNPENSVASANEISMRSPAAGTYTVANFTFHGVNLTPNFEGYTIAMNADGSIVVSTPDSVFTGTWKEDDEASLLSIDISGSRQMERLDNNYWNVEIVNDQGFKAQSRPESMVLQFAGY